MPNGQCPDCDADVHIDPIEGKGNTLLCEECGVELEIVGLDPVAFEVIEDDDEDDDDDDDDDEY